jgi:pSer/pThr/pTyr-binding forkhead associated (FHA) protein
MPKLVLKFEETVIKEVSVGNQAITIGRGPDNDLAIDNLAVSSHHAKIYREGDHLIVEDLNSLNGTFVNNQRVQKANLKHGDTVLVGKHSINVFHTGWAEPWVPPAAPKAAAPKIEETVMMDPKRRKELLEQALAAQAAAKAGGAPAAPGTAPAAPAVPAAPARVRIPSLVVVAGSTDQKEYQLTSKLTVIGKSNMATVKIRGFFARLFAPDVAAQINKKDDGYYLAAAGQVPTVNGSPIGGPTKLNDGDTIEVGKLKFTFAYKD